MRCFRVILIFYAMLLAIKYASAQSTTIDSLLKLFLELIAEGYTNLQIAEKLFVRPFTVDSHRKNLLAKLNVKNTASLVRLAVERNLI